MFIFHCWYSVACHEILLCWVVLFIVYKLLCCIFYCFDLYVWLLSMNLKIVWRTLLKFKAKSNSCQRYCDAFVLTWSFISVNRCFLISKNWIAFCSTLIPEFTKKRIRRKKRPRKLNDFIDNWMQTRSCIDIFHRWGRMMRLVSRS